MISSSSRHSHRFALSAFTELPNLLALAVAGFLCLRLPLLLVPVVLAELGYLYVMPRLRWYRNLVVRRHERDVIRRMSEKREQLAAGLGEAHAGAYRRILETVDRISRLHGGQGVVPALAGSDLVRVHQLIEAYVRMAATAEHWRSRLAETSDRQIEQEVAEARRKLEQAPASTAGVLRRNLEIVQSRRDALAAMARAREELLAQLELLENSFQLLLDRVLGAQRAGDHTIEMESLLELVSMTEQVARDGESIVNEVQTRLRAGASAAAQGV